MAQIIGEFPPPPPPPPVRTGNTHKKCGSPLRTRKRQEYLQMFLFILFAFFIETIILVRSTSTLQFNWHSILLFKRYSSIFKRCYNKPYKSYTLLPVYNTTLPDLTLVCQVRSYASKKARKMAIRSSIKCGLLCYTVIIKKSLGLEGKEVTLRRVIFVQIQNAKKKNKRTQLRFQSLVAPQDR